MSSAPGTMHARLKADLKTAMKSKDKARLPVIKSILSDILYAEKNVANGALFSKESDADVAGVVQRAIQRRRESIQSFVDGDRPELASEEKARCAVLEGYLPKQLSAEEIEARAKEVIEQLGVSGVKGIGPVLRAIDIDPAQAPKNAVGAIVKRLLTQ
ncbi:hypothetical protein GGF46_005364 [Coemansia sp. RSA 552]|nr:hypothetical protein GGF46_005364 [Coemansia sp. RSA 552]